MAALDEETGQRFGDVERLGQLPRLRGIGRRFDDPANHASTISAAA